MNNLMSSEYRNLFLKSRSLTMISASQCVPLQEKAVAEKLISLRVHEEHSLLFIQDEEETISVHNDAGRATEAHQDVDQHVETAT